MSAGDMLALWLRSYGVAWRCLVASRPSGVGAALLLGLALPILLLVQLGHWIGLLLDELVFPEYREVEISEPLFVVGMPRSGTSFLHATLAEDDRFTTLRLWELLLAPSVTERRAWQILARLDEAIGSPGRRVGRLLERNVQGRMQGAHPVDLEAPGEDFLLLMPPLACFLLVVAFPTSPAVWELTDVDCWPEDRRLRLFGFYRACLQRHVYARGDTDRIVLSKNPSFTACIGTLRQVFPDARFVCCHRDPAEAIPSQLSSLRAAADLFGYDPADPAIRDRFVDMYRRFVRHSLDSFAEDSERARFLSFPRLTGETDAAVNEIYAAFGWKPSDAFRRKLTAVAERSRGHRSSHRYDPSEFGLREDDLRMDFEADMRGLEARSIRPQGAPA